MALSRRTSQQRECHQGAIPALNIRLGRHRIDDVLDLFQGRYLLLPLSCSDAGVLVRQIEILGIGILQTRLVARLPRQPLEESLELRKCRMQGRLAQLLPGLLPLLLGKMFLEGNGLLKVKCLEISIPGIGLKATQRLRGRIDRRLTVTFGLLQKSEVLALDPFILCIVLFHGLLPLISSHCSRWVWHSQLCVRSACGKLMSISPRIWPILARLTRRFMMASQSGQIAIRLPNFSVTGEYSAMSPAGNFGARQRTQ